MFSICAAARGRLLILLSLLVVFPTCGHYLWLIQVLAGWWHWAAELGKGSTQSLTPLLLLAPLGAHREEAQLPVSNFLRCSERQEQVRQEKVSSFLMTFLTYYRKKSQILLSLACKMAENHLAASGTVARYQLDRAQIHQAIYHCHSCEEKELYPAHVGCTSKPSLCYIHAAPPQFFCHGFPAACPLNSLPQLLYKTGSLQEHGWQRDCLKSHSSSVVKDKAVLGVLPCQGSSGVSLVLLRDVSCCGLCRHHTWVWH